MSISIERDVPETFPIRRVILHGKYGWNVKVELNPLEGFFIGGWREEGRSERDARGCKASPHDMLQFAEALKEMAEQQIAQKAKRDNSTHGCWP